MFWREAPESFGHFGLICNAKSLMFWREAPKKNWHFQKNYNLGRQDFKKKNLDRKIPEFWVPTIKGGYKGPFPYYVILWGR